MNTLERIEEILADVNWCRTFEVTNTPTGTAKDFVEKLEKKLELADDYIEEFVIKARLKHWQTVLLILERNE